MYKKLSSLSFSLGLGTLLLASPAAYAACTGNLLVNPSFEYTADNVLLTDGQAVRLKGDGVSLNWVGSPDGAEISGMVDNPSGIGQSH